MKLIRMQYYKKGSYPVFYVEFPWDPMSGVNTSTLKRLEAEIYVEIGQSPYAIIDMTDKIKIEMTPKHSGKGWILEENIVPLEGGKEHSGEP